MDQDFFVWIKFSPIMLTGDFLLANVYMVLKTLAAPPISARILSILDDDFNDIPPLSKVIPLPTKTRGFVSGALL